MKSKTFSILFTLVMILSLSAGVLAQDYTWDEETVLTVFNDVDIIFPDLFADIDSDFLFVSDPDAGLTVFPQNFQKDGNDYAAKALAEPNATMTATFDPCGDGLIKFDVTVNKADAIDGEYYGPDRTFYIRDIEATYKGDAVEVKKCTSTGNDDCHAVKFNSKGVAHVTGYLYVSDVLETGDTSEVEITIYYSKYMTALWPVDVEDTPIVATTNLKESKNNYCQATLQEYELGGVSAVRGRYDQNTGEARLQATIRNYKGSAQLNYAIPAEVIVPAFTMDDDGNMIDLKYERYTDYTCKYTVYSSSNAAPLSDYCEFGEGIALPNNSVIRFDITVDHLSSDAMLSWEDDAKIPFAFRVGGMTYLVGTNGNAENKIAYDGNMGIFAAFTHVEFPCPPVSRINVMDPLKPFMTFYGMESDDAIQPSGAYGVYEGGVWGLYQKCGKYAYMAVRLKNDGIKTEYINLNHVAIAINGGTPVSWSWVLSTVEAEDNIIELEAGDDVILFLRAKVTDATWQLNSDLSMTGAVNFLDYGYYVTGKIYSDHNNTNCSVAP